MPNDYVGSTTFNVCDFSPCFVGDDEGPNLRTNSFQEGGHNGGPYPTRRITRSTTQRIQDQVRSMLLKEEEIPTFHEDLDCNLSLFKFRGLRA